MTKKKIVIGIIILFILSSLLPAIRGLDTEADNSDSNNTEYTGFDDKGQLLNVDTPTQRDFNKNYDANGPLGEWPSFTPIGFITAPHPNYPEYQTHLYGDWGGIVGEEFLFLQNDTIKLLYHSYHETYMTQREYEYSVLDNWSLGYDPVTKIKFTPLVKPGGVNPGPAWEHTDTPGYIQHPLTGEHLLYNTVRPGTKYLHPEWDGLPGWEGAIQVATSDTPPTIGVPFEQTYENMLVAEYWWEQGWNQNGVVKGGLSEPTPVWVPHLGTNGKVRLFYRGLHGSPGSYWNWRISYADSEDGKTGWVKNPEPTFDPSDPSNPAYQWTLPWPEGFSFRGAWQAHCTGDVRADGVHMVLMVSNQNYAGYGHIAYYWSPDWGETWIGHPDNPIIAPGQFPQGVPPEGFQRTPTLLIDEKYNRYILAYNAGHDINEKWKRRTYLATASCPPIINLYKGWNLITVPTENTWSAETLGQNITNCTVISGYNSSTQTFNTHVIGVPWDDFPIEDGMGYYAYVDNDSAFTFRGLLIDSVNISIHENWNLIGWCHDYPSTAESLGENISGCSVITMFNAENQTFMTYVVGVPHDNFAIEPGMGLFIYTTEGSYWHGEG